MLATWLQESKHTVVLTGAGMSTESGLPDFRSALRGIWRGKDPSKLASTYALTHNREEFISFYRMRIEGLQQCNPHIGHEILAKWEQKGIIKSIVTQNVDGFHMKAGNQNVSELHGTLRTIRCSVCAKEYPSARFLEIDETVCECGGFVRPSVVLFGESLPINALKKAEQQMSQADLCIVMGSSLQVSPANMFPIMAKENGAKLVIVNREPTELDFLADLLVNDRMIGEYLQEIQTELGI